MVTKQFLLAPAFSFSVDEWTTKLKTRSFLGITVHWGDDKGVPQILPLDLVPFHHNARMLLNSPTQLRRLLILILLLTNFYFVEQATQLQV
jgi:hypothetical protein